jgi:hypothetical protein
MLGGFFFFLFIGVFARDAGMQHGMGAFPGAVGASPAFAAERQSNAQPNAGDVSDSARIAVADASAGNGTKKAQTADTVPVPVLTGRPMSSEVATKYPDGKFVPRVVRNGAFGAGEHLVFSVDYGFYKAGIATMSVLDVQKVGGVPCYHIRTTAESNKFISSFYKVRDKVESYIDTQGIFSRRFEKHLREGTYSMDELVDLYHGRQIALSTREKYALVEIPQYVQDILSTLYYIRTFDLKVGKTETIETYADGKVYPLKVYVNKREKVEVPAGKFNCLQIEPQLKSEGIFRQKGRLLVWVTDDQYKMPVKMTSKVTIGSIATKLESYKKSEAK